MKVKEIAEKIGGKVEGDPEFVIESIAPIESASENDLTFLAEPKLAKKFAGKTFGCLVVSKIPEKIGAKAYIVVSNVRSILPDLLQLFAKEEVPKPGISSYAYVDPAAEVHPTAVVMGFAFIDANAKIGAGTVVYPFVFIGQNASIGERCILYPHVFIGRDVVIGNRVIVHAGASIGADGFGFERTEKGYRKIPQIGTVIIEDDVEIGANTCIDRATLGETRVKKGTKIDNLVQIGHNSEIGRNVVIAGMSGVAGSTKVGDWAMIGGYVAIADHLNIGEGAILTGKTGVISDLEGGKIYSGFYARERTQFLRAYALMLKLPELVARIKQLERELERLKNLSNGQRGNS